ncbi:MAG: molybdopterin-dependent oxidoreductase [Peptococcaceae bacterium]|jgi:anaerobic dimethyl sulfoxide reductase subunit A|nr:molybdopterin-dependent oxidoreductase [Peptococcaceae bacterium]
MPDSGETGRARESEIVGSAVGYDCGGRCPLKVQVKNGIIRRIEGDDGEPERQLRACLRCRAYRQVVYAPDRLRYPMKRVGERGEGRFGRISWAEALQTVAGELVRVKELHGNSSILLVSGGGNLGALGSSVNAYSRLLSLFGGFTTHYGNPSAEGAIVAARAQYGDLNAGNSREDLQNARLIILWGWDPAKMIGGTNTTYQLALAREAGAKIIAVDPKYTDTAAAYADRWIPVRPGTDAALIAALAYVMIKENLHDRAFLDSHTTGFKVYQDYVLGREDETPKDPAWAEAISGVPADTVERLAREYAAAKPAALMGGLGPQRSAAGEQFTRSVMTLAAMGGNVGVPGGSAGDGLQRIPLGEGNRNPGLAVPRNQVEAGGPSLRGSLDLSLRLARRVHWNKIWDAVLEGKNGDYPADFKLVIFCATNALNQMGNLNKGIKALKKIEFIIVPEIFMTPTAKFADILLPVPSHLERNDLYRPWPSGPYFVYGNKAVDPMYESKSDFQICCELAPLLGIKDYNLLGEDATLDSLMADAEDMNREIADLDKFRRDGVHRIGMPDQIVAFEQQINDPSGHPFPTPSGKIEIYSEKLAELNNPALPAIPKYVAGWEGPDDPQSQEYPLQLISDHCGRRTHSQLDNVPWLRELEPQTVWINTADAAVRGIRDGDLVSVFNDRGEMAIPARVTGRIMPGVVSIQEGSWHKPDRRGIDRGGCANVLTNDGYSPAGSFPANTCLVQVRKPGA